MGLKGHPSTCLCAHPRAFPDTYDAERRRVALDDLELDRAHGAAHEEEVA